MPQEPNKRFVELDMFRGVAVLMVALFHYFTRYDQLYDHDLPAAWASLGEYGVHLFFIVSGFVIFWSVQRTEKPLDFVVARFSRLYPTYWVGLTISFLVVTTVGLSGREVDVDTFMFNFTMAQGFVDHFTHVDGVYWSLKIELMFYGWIYLLLLVRGLRFIDHLGFALLIATLGIVTTAEFSAGWLPVRAINKLFFTEYISYFVAGICFFKIWSGKQSRLIYASLALSMVINCFQLELVPAIFVSCFYPLFYLAVTGFFKSFTFAPLLFLGSVSYPFYLIHQNVGYVIMQEGEKMMGNMFVAIVMAFAVNLALAYLMHKTVETHATRWLKQPSRNIVFTNGRLALQS